MQPQLKGSVISNCFREIVSREATGTCRRLSKSPFPKGTPHAPWEYHAGISQSPPPFPPTALPISQPSYLQGSRAAVIPSIALVISYAALRRFSVG